MTLINGVKVPNSFRTRARLGTQVIAWLLPHPGQGRHPALGATWATAAPSAALRGMAVVVTCLQPPLVRLSSPPWPGPRALTVTLVHTVSQDDMPSTCAACPQPRKRLCPRPSPPGCWPPWQTVLGREHQGYFQNSPHCHRHSVKHVTPLNPPNLPT